MDFSDFAQPVSWTVPNRSPGAAQIQIAGWDFGGTGPVALLHHANGMCGACWAPVARHLARDYRVFAIDARGHGASQALDVPGDYAWDYLVDDLHHVATAILKVCDQTQIALGVGSSFGGIVTANAAARWQDLFAHIYLFDPPIHPTAAVLDQLGLDLPLPAHNQAALVAQTLKRKAIWDSREQAHAAWREKPLFAPWTDEGFRLYLEHGLRDRPDGRVELACQPQVEAHIFESTGSMWVPDFAARISVPVELIHAAQGFFPAPFFRALTGLFPAGRFHQMDAGHMLPLEVPESVVQLIESTA